MTITINGTTGISGVDGSSATPALQGTDTNTGISYGTDIVTINTGGTARVTTDASGNVGIATASPVGRLTLQGAAGTNGINQGLGLLYSNGVQFGALGLNNSSGWPQLMARADAGITFHTNSDLLTTNERARIDSSGNFLVGTTSAIAAGKISLQKSATTSNGLVILETAAGGGDQIVLLNSLGNAVGVISQNGTTTTYATSSDYRLKENVAPMQNALATVAALKPCTYTWKSTGEAGQGFIAHELQAVVPDCVTGEKDAVETVDDLDAEGKKIGTKEVPRYQGVDTSFLVATLVAAIQELKAEFDAYKATHP